MSTADRRPAFYRAYEQAASVLSGVGSDQLGRPTPCTRFDVAELVDHLVGAAHRAAELGRGVSPAAADFPHIELADAPGEVGRAAKEAEAAWSDDRSLSRTITMPWGEEYTGSTLVDMYLAELAAHAWDLATATGQVERLDPELAGVALEGAGAMLKPEYRDAMEEGSPYGREQPAPPDATEWERFAAFMGRVPRP